MMNLRCTSKRLSSTLSSDLLFYRLQRMSLVKAASQICLLNRNNPYSSSSGNNNNHVAAAAKQALSPVSSPVAASPIGTTKRKEEEEQHDGAGWKLKSPFSPSFYLDLTKSKLTTFVLLTTMAGYAIAPGIASVPILLATTVGTGFCVASANAFNQWTEVPYDAQMSRTRNRVLVRHAMSQSHAFMFGAISGIGGTVILYYVSPISALLGFLNIILYTCVYTPLKRISIYNTWPGALVGAIPPLIGWVACTGSLDLASAMPALALYAWQFPHFNSLSWNLRPDYSKAGYMMMSVIDPAMNARVSLRYALLMFPISLGFYTFDITTIYFLLDSSLINGYMAYYAYNFWREKTDSRARSLFFSSLVHLPVFLILAMIHKKEAEKKSKEDDDLSEEERV